MNVHAEANTETPRDLTLPEGCMLCGGELVIRLSPAGAASVCKACRWISRPHFTGDGSSVQLSHPAGGIA